ncbi:MAG TPA: D-alanine--D-alanine ligase [Chthoniobacterales bacterium]
MTTLAGKRIAVLMGGPGSERNVSLATGRGVSKALQSLGAQVTEVDVHGREFELPANVDLAFNTIHGTFGEDGQVQKILERRGVAYTGEGVEGSEIAFDKIQSKERFQKGGISTPEWEVITVDERPSLALPIVIKPPREGSTVGVHIIKSETEIYPAMRDLARFGRDVLVESFISGRELTVGVLGDQALPIIEIIPKGGFYDFTNKYPFLNPAAGGGAQHVCPANIEEAKTKEIQRLARRAHRALGLEVYSRVDVILADDGSVYVLEANTIPGMTETSLLPEAAAVAGISYPDLCVRIIELSQKKKNGGATK